MDRLRDLNGLGEGINKKWIWGNKENYYCSCDCLQKIGYCIHDLNTEIENLSNPSMKEVIFIIILVNWICEASDTLLKILDKGMVDNFVFKNEDSILKSRRFFKALRSFAVAHPLSTNRHEKYGFDGDLTCVDIRDRTSKLVEMFTHSNDWFHLDFNGLKVNTKNQSADFVLYVYSHKADGMKFFKYIGVDFKDLYCVAELQIEKIYELDKYLKKIKKKDWLVNA